MSRRTDSTIYLTEDLIQRILERRPIRVWDYVNILFPQETNQKQFDCAFKFLSTLEKQGCMTNSEVRKLFESSNEKVMLMGHVLPKIQRFGLVETDAETNSKKYNIYFSRKFTLVFRDLGLEWLEYYAKHKNDKPQLERNPQ